LAGSATVGLGPNVLRAETAAVVGSALLVAIREGLTAPATNSG
jgi:16S rRNA U1498 N3-methylase RsmE